MKKFVFLAVLLGAGAGLSAQIISPDTVCVNTPVLFSTPGQGVVFTWMLDNVSLATTLTTPAVPVTSQNMANNVNATIHKDGADYYGLSTNYGTNEVIKLAFGTSPLNTPTVTNLGTFGMNSGITEGVEIVREGANYYAFVVSGSDMLRLAFGTSLANTPTGTLMSFPNSLAWPHQIALRKIAGQWVGFVANRNGSVTRFEWGTGVTGIPTPTNLPLVGGMANPCHFVLHQQGSNWHMLVSNLINGTVSRLDFGPNLTNNSPTGTLLGSFNVLSLCRSIDIVRDCDEFVGYIHNESGAFFRMDFGGSITNTPTLTQVGFLGSGLVNSFHPFVYNDRLHYLISVPAANSIDRREIHTLPPGTVTKWYDSTFTHTFTAPGTYNITLHTDQAWFMGGKAACKTIVVLSGSGTALALKDSGIACRTVLLSAPGTTSSVQWTFGDGSTGSGNPVTHVYTGPGPYTVTATTSGTGSGPCSGGGSGTLVVTPPAGLAVTASRDTIVCRNSPVQLGATGGATYQWSPAAGLDNPASATPVATPGVTTTYTVTGTSADGCTGSDTVRIAVTAAIAVVAFGDGQPISCNNSLAQLHATGASSYVWHPGQYLNDSTQANPVATPPVATSFVVEGRSGDGCVGRDTVRVLVEPGATHYIPNVFTPNGDRINDVVYPTVYCDFRFERFAMFNRWGQMVFDTKMYGEGWDGKFNGQPADQGVFTYFISGTTSLNRPVLFKGNVTLLR